MSVRLAVCIAAFILSCSTAFGATLTFDDVPSGTALQYASYGDRLFFSGNLEVSNHEGSTWGPPHSGSNVLTMASGPYYDPTISFGVISGVGPYLDQIKTVGAYFSIERDRQVRITAYRLEQNSYIAVTSIVIGAPGEFWDNRYIEINSAPGSYFSRLKFEGVNSPDDLLGFCLDDLTITPVPEPSSLLALATGLVGMGCWIRKRKVV